MTRDELSVLKVGDVIEAPSGIRYKVITQLGSAVDIVKAEGNRGPIRTVSANKARLWTAVPGVTEHRFWNR